MATRHQGGSSGRSPTSRTANKDELKSDKSKEIGESGRGNRDQFGSEHNVDDRTRQHPAPGPNLNEREAAQDERKPTGKVRTGKGQQHKPRGK